ncbi:MAG TPA: glycosyltransferase, partial [Burkholderiales bacterium]|nr:glycosyltransferase [Burkholderiales bacterium]
KTLEFMACGVPLIVSRTSIDSYYFDDSLVRFVEPGNVDDLAAALTELYESRDVFSSRVALARDFAKRNSWQRRSQDYDQLVGALAGSVPPAKMGAPLGN